MTMHKDYSDKGWLRAHYPRATSVQIERFTERVALKLEPLQEPSQTQRNEARQQAFNDMMGLCP